jgi:LysM repeat protein
MNENLDNEMKDFEGQIADDLGYTQKDETIGRRKSVIDFRAQRKTLILGGAGVLLLIILIVLFSGGDGKLSTGDLTSIQVRLDQLEKRLTRLEGIEARIASLEKQEQRPMQSAADRSEESLTQRLETLSHRIDQLEKTMASAPAKTEASVPSQRKPSPPDKGPYHEVRSGENLYRIALQYGITVDELCRLNNMTPEQVIHPGQKLLVVPEGNQ